MRIDFGGQNCQIHCLSRRGFLEPLHQVDEVNWGKDRTGWKGRKTKQFQKNLKGRNSSPAHYFLFRRNWYHWALDCYGILCDCRVPRMLSENYWGNQANHSQSSRNHLWKTSGTFLVIFQQMEYTSKFLDECLRMWAPAVGVLSRLTREETTIGPYKLPPDFNVGTNILGLGYNTRFYTNPDKFDPDRWNDKSMLTN